MKGLSIIISFICMGYSTVVCADYDAASLEKLFTDKRQRLQIDAERAGRYSGSDLKQVDKVNINGYMTRSDGKSVVWVNDKSTLESSNIGDIKVQHSSIGKRKKVVISVDGKTARLKPGETWVKDTGKIIDSQR